MSARLFPFRPNWRRPVLERLEWLTDIIAARTGVEQRRSLRQRPRRTMEYELLLQTSALQRFDALLWSGQAQPYVLPIWTDPQRLSAPVGASSDTLFGVQTAGMDFEAGQYAVLIRDDARHEVLAIDEVGASSLTFTAPTAHAWPAGTLLYPARLARLPASASVVRRNRGTAIATLRWDIEPAPAPSAYTAPEYEGLPVFLRRPSWRREISTQYDRRLERIDVGTGPVFLNDVSGLPELITVHRHTLPDRVEISAWRAWLHARAGRWKAYWQPQWSDDLRQTAPIAASSTLLRVSRIDAALYEQDEGRRHLALRHRSGQWYFRQVEDAEPSGDDDVLTLDSALGFTANPGDFPLICWLMRTRLDTDAVEIAWHTAGVAESEVAIRSIVQ